MAEAWVEITETELKHSMTSLERDVFGKTVVDGAPSDRVPGILCDVTAMVRSYIASCERNVMDADVNLIPRMAMHHALAICRWRLLTTIPKYNPGEPRKEEYDRAISFLEEMAKCKIMPPRSINPQPAPDTPQSSNGPRICARRRKFSQRHQEGI